MAEYLAYTSTNHKAVDLEKAILKIIDGKEAELTEAEAHSVARFRVKESGSANERILTLVDEYDPEIFIRAKKAKLESALSKYSEVKYIPPTLNVCERVFRCKSMSPKHGSVSCS